MTKNITDRRSRNDPKYIKSAEPTKYQSHTYQSNNFPGSLVDYDVTMDEDDWLEMENVNDITQSSIINVPTDVDSTVSALRRNTCLLNSTTVSSEPTTDEDGNMNSASTSNDCEDGRYKYTNLGPWERYSSGVPSKILNRMGFKGQGLGKDEDGIREPIKITQKKDEFQKQKKVLNLNSKDRIQTNYVKPWPIGTTLITGSSILCGIQESRLKKAKVRVFLGANVDDMYDYLTPLLKKRPSNIILHIGSNDAPFKSSDTILKEITNLKMNIMSILPSTKIYISCPILRLDNKNANEVLQDLKEKIKNRFNDIVLNDKVDSSCLGKKGLHLNPKGSGRLAMNFISLLRRL